MSFYDAAKDPAAIELAKQLPNREVSNEKLLEALKDAEPERLLCIICMLEVASGDYTGLADVKKTVVNEMLAKMGEVERL